MREKLHPYRWLFISAFWIIGLTLGLLGWMQVTTADAPKTIDDLIYLTLQLIVLESGANITGPNAPWMLRVARYLLPGMAAYTTIGVLLITFKEQMQWLSLTRIRNHTVICGLGRKAFYLTRSFRESGHQVVVIEDDTQNDYIPVVREMGAIVLIGSPKDPLILRQAAIQRADHVIIVDEDDDDNVAIAAQVQNVIDEVHSKKNIFKDMFRDDILKVVVHLSDPVYVDLFQKQTRYTAKEKRIAFKTFNIHREAALIMWENSPNFTFSGKLYTDAHLLVIGLGQFGQNLILHAAQAWKKKRKNPDVRLHVTIIDKNASYAFASFLRSNPEVEKLCVFHLAEIDVHSHDMLTGDYLAPDLPPISAAYVCLDNDHLSLDTAFALTESFKKQSFPISVRLLADTGIAPWLMDYYHARHPLHVVTVLDEVCTTKIVEG